ncbi:MAG: hypothetical protein HGB22_04455 [Chlorobiaceae bacterium]|nr:hypothetical protein [Chlorobiaceae bacterium]
MFMSCISCRISISQDTMSDHHEPDKSAHATKRVTLSLTDDAGELLESVSATFTADDISLLQKYVCRVGRVRLCRVLKRGMPTISSLATIMGFNLDPYTKAELHDLLHQLTPLILQDEAASFHNISGLLSQKIQGSNFADNLTVVRQIFEHGEDSLYKQIGQTGQQLFHSSLSNTEVIETDRGTDIRTVERGAKPDRKPFPKKEQSVGVKQLQGKVKALLMLEYIVNLVLENGSQAEMISKGA